MADDDRRAPLPPPVAHRESPMSPTDDLLPRSSFKPQEEPQQQPSSAEEQPSFPRDDEATAHQRQSDAEPMKSAHLAESASSGGDAMETLVDLERVRIKMELARVRATGGPVHGVPSGRVFDAPPGGGEATDGKPATAEVQTAMERIRSVASDAEDDEPLIKKKSSKVLTVKKLELPEKTKRGVKMSPRESDAIVPTPTGAKLDKNSQGEVVMASNKPTALEMKENHSVSEGHASDSASAVAPPAPFNSLAVVTTDTSSSNLNRVKIRTVPTENRPLNEYLVSELELFASVMLDELVPSKARSIDRAAHATTLQLYYDHTRALRDFDAEWKRSHVGLKRWTHSRSGGSPTNKANGASTVLPENPFKRNESTSTHWPSILESVRPPSVTTERHQSKQSGGDARFDLMYQRGLNGVVVADITDYRRIQHRQKLRTQMVDLAQRKQSPGLHIVIASNRELLGWKSQLEVNDQVRVYPYWGEKEDRQQVLAVLRAEYYSRQTPAPHVLVTSYDIFAEDLRTLGIVQWQLALVEVPFLVGFQEQMNAVWMQLLCLRARHRLLISHTEFHVDSRRVLQFLLPELFSSRRKLLAWNCAAFDVHLIHRMVDMIEAFSVCSDPKDVQAFLASVNQHSIIKSDDELTTLSLLNRSGGLKRTVPSRVKHADGKTRQSKSLKSKIGAAVREKAQAKKLSEDLSIQLSNKKRRGSDGTPRSRKRISRCGKCAGCLADDCMKCGHCQDMKKYGGPGLRKQSCKNRKCISPKRWGMTPRKSKKARVTKQSGKGGNDEDDEDATSEKYDTDFDGDDDGATSYYSQDSDRDSSYAPHDVVHSDSDGREFLRSSDDVPLSPGDINLLSNEKLQDDDFESSHQDESNGELSSKSSRTREMRCGKCSGCTASDCMKCLHCLDKKKYGGPGLRKQSCKNRKCIVPKVVLLNQSKDDEYVDDKGNVVYPGDYEGSDVLDGAALYHMNGNLGGRTAMISLIQECEIFIDRHLVFTCALCVARFSSRGLLELHERVEHPPFGVESRCGELEKEASRMLLHPIHQNCFIHAQLREKKETLQSCPCAYVKLQGSDFQYFMMEPYVVLGRLSSQWRDFYGHLGLSSANGLAGGGVDCHIGDDESISEKHALISWDFKAKHFTIECLSAQVPISVNGSIVRLDDEPLALESQNEIQVGSSSFYFLLPKVPSDEEQPTSTKTLPRSELQAWLNATMQKRRASASARENSNSATSEAAMIKKRCQERLAAAST